MAQIFQSTAGSYLTKPNRRIEISQSRPPDAIGALGPGVDVDVTPPDRSGDALNTQSASCHPPSLSGTLSPAPARFLDYVDRCPAPDNPVSFTRQRRNRSPIRADPVLIHSTPPDRLRYEAAARFFDRPHLVEFAGEQMEIVVGVVEESASGQPVGRALPPIPCKLNGPATPPYKSPWFRYCV